VEPKAGEGSLIELSGQGRRWRWVVMYGLSCARCWPGRSGWRCARR